MLKITRQATYDPVSGDRLSYKIGQCDCGRRIELTSGWANTCECGREYNGSGQELAPRCQWGEETGETMADMEGPGGGDW